MKRTFLAISLLVCMLLSFVGCASHPIAGTYKPLTDELFDSKEAKLVLKAKDDESGTFAVYDEDGNPLNASNKRYTWTFEDNIVTLTQSDDSLYLYVSGNALILVDEDGKAELHDYIAPKGKRFDWECNGYVFFDDGTYTSRYDNGNYYVKDNTIFVASEDDEEYKAKFYIYDDDYITYARYVFLKK
ncbi:MAG: hypothetical protein IJY20_00755 [Clostridia bacterium]|nr:hypothetical protein [Clostridia bacterium]